MRVNVVNIGCFKNLVDCELLIWQLRNSGVEVSFGQTDIYADIVHHQYLWVHIRRRKRFFG